MEGCTEEDSLCMKGPEKKEHVNLPDKEEGRRERKEGAWVKAETITFSFVQVFLCVHVCARVCVQEHAGMRNHIHVRGSEYPSSCPASDLVSFSCTLSGGCVCVRRWKRVNHHMPHQHISIHYRSWISPV